VTIGGIWRGHTPMQLPLPAGARYEVLVSQPGYESITRVVDAQAGASLVVDAKLAPIMVELRVSGDPADAELWIDGTARGKLPASISLLAGTHAVEVRRSAMQTWTNSVELAPGLPRALEYRLVPEGRPAGWTPPAASIVAKNGPMLKLLKGGSFLMGSARREQGRRPNEGQLRVTLSRPFYIGVREVTNAEFRRFRADHVSGVVNQQSIDLDNQAVTNVTWEQAVEYCNWLSAQDGLPAAYESKDGSWVLRQPANNGYRLPTEAEWEFAARMGSGSPRRFEWGEELPIPPGVGNIAGAEAAKVVDPVLPAYRDEYVSVASVGRFAANAFGLYDMTGNVSEWTHDVYTSFIDGAAVTDPLGPPAGARHTVRGASWRSATISELRLAWREGASEPTQDLGFRVARYAE
jgi:formylglycine-generating enzyme required for sulfatase activity